jgi:hypothetical protein
MVVAQVTYSEGWYQNVGTLIEIQTQINKYRTGEYIMTTAAQLDIIAMISGLQQRLTATPINENTNYAHITERNENLDIEIIQATQDLQVMKERVASLRSPYATQSYYESWFPINRPLRNISIVVLIALGIFFYVFTLFSLMHSLGLHIRLNISWWSPENMVKFGKLVPYAGGLVLVGLLALIVVAYVRKG